LAPIILIGVGVAGQCQQLVQKDIAASGILNSGNCKDKTTVGWDGTGAFPVIAIRAGDVCLGQEELARAEFALRIMKIVRTVMDIN